MQPEKLKVLFQLKKSNNSNKNLSEGNLFFFPRDQNGKKRKKKRKKKEEKNRIRLSMNFMYADLYFSRNRMKATS